MSGGKVCVCVCVCVCVYVCVSHDFTVAQHCRNKKILQNIYLSILKMNQY